MTYEDLRTIKQTLPKLETYSGKIEFLLSAIQYHTYIENAKNSKVHTKYDNFYANK